MAETFDLGRNVIRRYGGQEFAGARVGRAGDESLVGVGIPALLMTVSEQPAVAGATGAAAVIGGRSGRRGWGGDTPHHTVEKPHPPLLAGEPAAYPAELFSFCPQPIPPL